MNTINYRIGNNLDLDQVIELYRASTLGLRRPVDDRATMNDMLRHANLVIAAWLGNELVGIARSLTDFSYICYLADLAVHEAHQKNGIGQELVRQTRANLGEKCKITLLAAPAAVEYYAKLGFEQHPSAWILHETQPITLARPESASRD